MGIDVKAVFGVEEAPNGDEAFFQGHPINISGKDPRPCRKVILRLGPRRSFSRACFFALRYPCQKFGFAGQ
jgi:hypothetical protein